jgi:DNA-binding XRE family transcriptional regulator
VEQWARLREPCVRMVAQFESQEEKYGGANRHRPTARERAVNCTESHDHPFAFGLSKIAFILFEPRLCTVLVTTTLSAEHPGGKPPRDFVPSLEVNLPCRTSAIFGQNLRRARLRARLTQGDLARRTGLKQQYISLIESGSQNVTILTADALASAVGRKLWTMVSLGDPPRRRS